MYTADTWPIAAKMNFAHPSGTPGPLNNCPSSVWETHLRQVVEMGFRWVDPIDEWIDLSCLPDDRFAELQRLLSQFDLQVPAVSCGRRSPIDPIHGKEHVGVLHRMAERASEIGATILNFSFAQPLNQRQKDALWFWHQPGHSDDPRDLDLAVERVREIADHAQRLGMEVSLEVYEDTLTGTAEACVELLRLIDHPAVGINPDFGNLIRLHRAIPSYQSMFDQVLPYSNYWHIKNYFRDEDVATGSYFTAPAPLELGLIDYRQIIRQAIQFGYRGAFQAEHYGGDWLAISARNAEYIRSILRRDRKSVV